MAELGDLASGPPLDVAVIGGGINGAAIARELALRGRRVALFEREDFGFGTTWRSTRLIHGGLRYLEHGDFRLVFESLRERAWLLKTRRHLVEPLRFLLPRVPWTRRPAWQLRLGLGAYDALSLHRGLPRHRALSDTRLHELIPFLTTETDGGFSFFDARALAPERLALELALEARAAGAGVLNHASVIGIDIMSNTISGVSVRHCRAVHTVPARAVVNAAGPSVDAVNRLTGEERPPTLGVTKGTHIVVRPAVHPGRDAIFSTAKSDGRVFFAVPQGELLLIGTTDTRYDGDPLGPRPTAGEVDYLVEEGALLLPGAGITRESVSYAFAGLRPLQAVPGGPEAAISRRHAVIDHGRDGGPMGLFSVVGGKLSTFRPLAREVAAALGATGPAREGSAPPGTGWRQLLGELPGEQRRALTVYGPAAAAVLAAGPEALEGAADAIEGQVRHAITAELATTLSDIILRRTGLGWTAERGLAASERVAEVAASLLGWDTAEREAQVSAFREDLRIHVPTLAELGDPA